jgi:hypothetical protein
MGTELIPAIGDRRRAKTLVRSRRWSRRLISLLIAVGLLIPSYVVNVAPVAAHCPAVPHVYNYTTAQTTITSNEGVEGRIQWTDPTVCTPTDGPGFTAEWVTTCDYQCRIGYDGWVQVGWVKRTNYSQPRTFCELAASQGGTGFGPPPYLIELGGSAGTYTYTGFRSYTPPYDLWNCMIEGSVKAQKLTSWMGFAYGDILIAGGETISQHSQMGKMYPSKLLLSDLAYINFGTYSTLNLSCCGTTASPWGKDEPAAGKLRNWTNAH